MSKALLLSGGLDSAALAVLERPEVGIFVDYGQTPADGEQRAASVIAEAIGLKLITVGADCSAIGSGWLSSRSPLDIAPIPEWWPFRNQLLITIAGAVAVGEKVDELLIGTVASDAQHVDGSRTFIEAIDKVMSIQEGNLRVVAPAIELNTVDLVLKSGLEAALGARTHSCHLANLSCGQCRGCFKRLEAFGALGWV